MKSSAARVRRFGISAKSGNGRRPVTARTQNKNIQTEKNAAAAADKEENNEKYSECKTWSDSRFA